MIIDATGKLVLENQTTGAGQAALGSSNNVITINTWNHVVYVYNSSTGFLDGYVNNTNVIHVSRGGNQSYGADNNQAAIGAYLQSGVYSSGGFNGYIDEVGFWSKALSTQEITDLYNGGAGQTMVNTSNLTRTQSDSIMLGATSPRETVLTFAQTILRSVAASIMNAASRFATLTGAQVLARAMSDSLMNAASRTVVLGLGMSRALSDAFMNATARLTTLSYLTGKARALSDAMMNAATSARLAVLSHLTILIRSISDAIMNAASPQRLATLTKGAEVLERFLSDSIMNAAGRFTKFIAKWPVSVDLPIEAFSNMDIQK